MNKKLTKQRIEVILISNDYGCFEIVDRDSIWVVTVDLDGGFSLPNELNDFLMSFDIRDSIIIYLKKELIK